MTESKKKTKRVEFTMFTPDKLTLRHIEKSVFRLKVDNGMGKTLQNAMLHNLRPIPSKTIRIEKMTFEDDIITIEGYEDE